MLTEEEKKKKQEAKTEKIARLFLVGIIIVFFLAIIYIGYEYVNSQHELTRDNCISFCGPKLTGNLSPDKQECFCNNWQGVIQKVGYFDEVKQMVIQVD